jgi:acetaldehyde dehydrogenase (acetylating)
MYPGADEQETHLYVHGTQGHGLHPGHRRPQHGQGCLQLGHASHLLSLFTVDGREEGLALCKQLLAREGAGLTAIIHTQDPHLAERYGLEMPASRILVNTSGSQGCCGISTGLTPSAVLGCGTLGRGSTSDNVTYTHLRNIKRVAYAL